MKNRLLVASTLLLCVVICLTLLQVGRDPASVLAASDVSFGASDLGFVAKSPLVGELVLVRTPDSEFLREPAPNPVAGSASPGVAEGGGTEAMAGSAEAGGSEEEQAIETPPSPPGADAGTNVSGDGKSVANEGDGKEIKDVIAFGSDGKDFKETVDPKSLPPIAAGGAVGGGGGGGGVGGGGGGGGSTRASEVAQFNEVREIEKSTDTTTNKSTSVVINRTIIRTVPQPGPVTPVPEPGNALMGIAVAAMASASFLRRQRMKAVGGKGA